MVVQLTERLEFRVRQAGIDPQVAPVVARFEATHVQRVFQHGTNLVLFLDKREEGNGQSAVTAVQLIDLRDPTRPREAGNWTSRSGSCPSRRPGSVASPTRARPGRISPRFRRHFARHCISSLGSGFAGAWPGVPGSPRPRCSEAGDEGSCRRGALGRLRWERELREFGLLPDPVNRAASIPRPPGRSQRSPARTAGASSSSAVSPGAGRCRAARGPPVPRSTSAAACWAPAKPATEAGCCWPKVANSGAGHCPTAGRPGTPGCG